jgi:dTDP-4-dehydrorhamnose reductase
MKILITGGQGQMGQALANHPLAKQHELILASRHMLDITHPESIAQAIAQYTPDVVINAAAYTAVDQAERDYGAAYKVNCDGAKHVAAACHQADIPILHLSTDYVFDGTKNAPYFEDDPVKPLNKYGQTKQISEDLVRQYSSHGHLILRISGLFGEYGTNFFKTMRRLQAEGKALRVVNDQMTCPTYTHDIAGAIFAIIQKNRYDGTYHFCSTPPVTWHAFAEIALQQPIEAITSAQMQRPAARPAYACFDCSKIQAVFGITPPSWKTALEILR